MPKSDPSQTPMMRQYASAKAENPDCLLLFHMGDFYELFGEDAVTASRVLGLTLTSRDKGRGAQAIPMCGVPIHTVDGYIEKLVRAGFRVAVCDQVEDPAKAKGLVKRAVTRVISAGTVLESRLLDAGRNNYLAAVNHGQAGKGSNVIGLAYVDLSTGEFVLAELAPGELEEELARIRPAELIVAESRALEEEVPYSGRRSRKKSPPPPDAEREEPEPPAEPGPVVTTTPDWVFDYQTARQTLLDHFGVQTLEGFGCEQLTLAIGAGAAIIRYLGETQKTSLAHIGTIRTLDPGAFVSLDASTIRNLELIETARERKKAGSLLGVLDRTRTAMGARLLRRWVLRPLRRVAEIRRRQGAVAELSTDMLMRESVREALGNVQDIERLVARVATRRADARDLLALAHSLQQAPHIAHILGLGAGAGSDAAGETPPLLAEIAARLRKADEEGAASAWITEIVTTLCEDAPAALREGGLIRDGIHAELDRLRGVRAGGKGWIAALQKTEAERTGIPSLKIGYNRVFGYYIEVTKTHQEKVPANYIRKQTLTNAERYITPELKEREEEVLGAEEKIVVLEYELFAALRERAAGHIDQAQAVASGLSELDVLASLADLAARNNYVCPDVDDSRAVDVTGGRHPTLETQLPRGEFVPNDLVLDAEQRQILLVTGPNMAGKSTYIRSAALWVLMAQMGSFVPADAARIGVADRVFTRVGAADDLGRGQSTFMVEMVETAYILNTVTDRSLVVLDEIGRGTSTFDGVAIAWAVVEFLHEHDGARARTLFATHYHELTELARALPRVETCNVAVREWQGEITFLHKIVPGATDRSYGVHVAKLAGVPREVVDRAWEVLEVLEKKTDEPSGAVGQMAARARRRRQAVGQMVQLPLFGAAESEVVKALADVDPSSLTPVEALKLLDELVQRAREERTEREGLGNE